MKILMVTASLGIGGAETHIITLAQALASRGHEIEIASGGGVYAENESFRHYLLPPPSHSPIGIIETVRRLSQIIKRGKYDAVHAHTRLSAFLAKCAGAAPLVTTAHWTFRTDFPYRLLSIWGEKTLAVSPDIREYLLRSYRISPENIHVTVNGIDTEKFSPTCKNAPLALLHISRLDVGRVRTAELLLTLFPALLKTYPALTLTLVGNGNRYEFLAKEAERINHIARRNAVRMLGASATPEEFLRKRPIFIGVSRAALEAMASACPVILCGDEGMLSLFSPQNAHQVALGERTNFCCRDASAVTLGGLHRAVLSALSLKEEERIALGDACRNYVKERYSVSRMANDALQIYASVQRSIYCGYYASGNVGDKLTLETLQAQTRGEILPISFKKDLLAPYRFLKAIHFMRPGTKFLLGGGNLLQNETSNRSLTYYTAMFRIAAHRGCRCELVSAGIGALKGEWAKKQSRRVLEKADTIRLRTRTDAETAMELTPACKERILLSHDAVLEHPFLNVLPLKLPNAYIVIALKPSKSNEEERMLISLFQRLHAGGFRLFYVAMHPKEDASYADHIQKSAMCGEYRECSSEGLAALVGGAAAAIGTRLHLAILALRFGVPFFSYRNDRKLHALYCDLEQIKRKNPAFHRIDPANTEKAAQEIAAVAGKEKESILSLAKELRMREEPLK